MYTLRISRELWSKVLLLYQEFKRRGEPLGRPRLMKMLGISENYARAILFALENRDIIRLEPLNFTPVKTELVIADIHIPFHDPLAVESALSYAERQGVDLIVILGDLVDFYKISTFLKNPSKKSVGEEIKQAKDFLKDLRQRFKNAKIIYKEGNHEFRLQRYLMKNAPEIYNLVDNLLQVSLELKDLNIEYVIEPFRVGKLWHLHGHERPGGSYNPEYITNVMWKYIHDHFIVGHYHRTQEKVYKRIDGKNYWGGAVGYLAKNLEYATLNNWTQGFAIIRYAEDGTFRAELRRIVNGDIF